MHYLFLSTGSPKYDKFPGGGGIQQQILGLALELNNRNHHVTILTKSPPSNSDGNIDYRVVTSPINDEVISRVIFGRNAKVLINKLDPDVLLFYERFSSVIPSNLDHPKVFFTGNYDAMKFYYEHSIRKNPLNIVFQPVKRKIEEHVMQKCDRVFTLTQKMSDYLSKQGIIHNSIIPNAIHPDEFRNDGENDFILFAGRLDPIKRCQDLLDAFSLIESNYPEYDLIITGKGSKERELKKYASELKYSNRIKFKGWVRRESLIELYSKCTIFVLPSLFEGLPVALLEAMASGKPVVVSNALGNQDIVEDGINGKIFPKRDIESLANCIDSLLKNEGYRKKLGQEARNTIKKEYSFDYVTNRIENEIEEII